MAIPRIALTTTWRAQGVAMLLLFALVLSGCVRPETGAPGSSRGAAAQASSAVGNAPASAAGSSKSIALAADPEPAQRTHTVLLGETLGTIAAQYGTDVTTLVALNDIEDANHLLPGRILMIPEDRAPESVAALEIAPQSAFDMFTDHELLFGLDARDFDLDDFVQAQGGLLVTFEEEVEGQILTGGEIVQLVAERHSVNPKLLLAILEYESGWLTEPAAAETSYPLGYEQEGVEGLYKQLSWAANLLNWGFYGRADGGLASFALGESEIIFDSAISDGTAGAQLYLAARPDVTAQQWQYDTGPEGLAATYRSLFGKPAVAENLPVMPANLQQPRLSLPWESGVTWNFSGGPHGGWNSGSAWAALDFVPPDVEYGCAQSDSWVTAVADGIVARSGQGAVVLDLDGDGYAGSGWAIIYMHLDNRDRIEEGTAVFRGDRLGHAGCEGGVSNGTHLHLARTYNGRWISADGGLPFDLDGWVSSGVGYEYNGWLTRAGETKTADVIASDDNAITAD